MQVNCPTCGKALLVKDEFLGRQVKCPGCSSILLLEATEPAAPPLPVAPPPVPQRPASSPPVPAPSVASAAPTLAEVAAAAHSEPLRVVTPSAPPAGLEGPAPTGEKPICYLSKGSDEAMAVSRAFRKLREVFATEGLAFQFVDLGRNPGALGELRPGDAHVTAGVTVCKQGSRAARYFLGPLIGAAVGGACKLEVQGEMSRAGAAPQPFTLKVSQTGGGSIFGGSGDNLMETNVKAIEGQLARKVAKWLTGRTMLNGDAYNCAVAALVMGLLSLIPFVGLVLFIPTMIVSALAWSIIARRQLPKRKTMALVGGLLGLAGLVIGIIFAATIR